jgi:chromosomal replication initiation ATPase DnaA
LSQLIFKFPFKTSYFEKDFFVSSNNFEAYKLIESWPKWPDKKLNIFGPSGCGKTHLISILSKKLKLLCVDAEKFDENLSNIIENYDCVVIDNYLGNIDEKLFYSFINQIVQMNKSIIINSSMNLKSLKFNLKDLKSRLYSFLEIKIGLPTDDLIRVIILKTLSDKQVHLSNKNLEFVIKNIDRSYDKISKFVKDVDSLSLSTGKSININLIKKVLKNE